MLFSENLQYIECTQRQNPKVWLAFSHLAKIIEYKYLVEFYYLENRMHFDSQQVILRCQTYKTELNNNKNIY